jgi:hypothetical protein
MVDATHDDVKLPDTGGGSSVTFSGLLLHYPCDDLTTTDTSGNSNTGTLFGSGNVLSTGLINNKITLSSSGGIQFTTTSALGLATAATAMSISCWIKTTTLDCTIVSLRNTGNGNTIIDLVLGYNGVGNLNTGAPSVLVRDDSGAGLNSINGSSAINDGNWHHIVWTRTTGKLNTLYCDNVSVGTVTDTMTGALTPNVAGSAIGYEIIAGGRPLAGSIDDYQVYNRALTTTEINSIYTAGLSSPGVSGALAVTEAKDTLAFAGTVSLPAISGTFAITEAKDAVAFAGTTIISGTLATTEATDAVAFAGTTIISGTWATTEAKDVASFVGVGVTGVSGTWATIEAQDVAVFAGSAAGLIGTLATTEAKDVAAFAGTVFISGTLATTEAKDVAAFVGSVAVAAISGVLAVIEAADTAAFVGTSVGLPSGVLATTEAADTAAFLGITVVPPQQQPGELRFGYKVYDARSIIRSWRR